MLTNPPVLDMAPVKSREELQAREELISEFITASEDLRDFCANAPDTYRRELLRHKLTPEARDASLKQFVQRVQIMNPTILALRKADVRRGEAMLKLVTFLEANWGQWNHDPAINKLRFQESKLADDYNRANHELEIISTETMRLQAETRKLSNTNM